MGLIGIWLVQLSTLAPFTHIIAFIIVMEDEWYE